VDFPEITSGAALSPLPCGRGRRITIGLKCVRSNAAIQLEGATIFFVEAFETVPLLSALISLRACQEIDESNGEPGFTVGDGSFIWSA